MQEYLSKAKAACAQLSQTSGKVRNEALLEMARAIRTERLHIIDANKKDMEYAKTIGLSNAMLDRLLLDEKRVNAMAA